MFDICPKVVAELEGDLQLIGLLGGKKSVFRQRAPDAKVYPRITFYEMNNKGALSADDLEIASEITIVVDVWSKGSTYLIAKQVDKVMKGLGFVREHSQDFTEGDTNHKHMRFKIFLEVDE